MRWWGVGGDPPPLIVAVVLFALALTLGGSGQDQEAVRAEP